MASLTTAHPVLLMLPCYRVDSGMCGVGVRAWELAQILGQYLPVTIITKFPSDLQAPGVTFAVANDFVIQSTISGCSAVIFYDMPDTRALLAAHRLGKLIITDNSVPIEHLEYQGVRGTIDPHAVYEDLVHRFNLQLLLSDHFIIRSQVWRATLIASLCVIRRLTYTHYYQSNTLDHLFTTIPIGYSRASSEHARKASPVDRRVDFIWTGGLWDYYNPTVVVEAVADLKRAGTLVTVHFLYPPPADQALKQPDRLRFAIRELGVQDLVTFETAFVPHYSRDSILLSAGAAVCVAYPGIENSTSVRLRLRDSFLYRLPLLVDASGATGDLARTLGIGVTVDPNRVSSVSEGLLSLRRGSINHTNAVAKLNLFRSEYEIDGAVRRLVDVISQHWRAPDADTADQKERIAEMLSVYPALEQSPRYPI